MTYCCSNECERRTGCAKWSGNAPVGYIVFVENFYSFGSGFAFDKGFCEITYSCGPGGNYAMFEPLESF